MLHWTCSDAKPTRRLSKLIGSVEDVNVCLSRRRLETWSRDTRTSEDAEILFWDIPETSTWRYGVTSAHRDFFIIAHYKYSYLLTYLLTYLLKLEAAVASQTVKRPSLDWDYCKLHLYTYSVNCHKAVAHSTSVSSLVWKPHVDPNSE